MATTVLFELQAIVLDFVLLGRRVPLALQFVLVVLLIQFSREQGVTAFLALLISFLLLEALAVQTIYFAMLDNIFIQIFPALLVKVAHLEPTVLTVLSAVLFHAQ